VEFLGECFVVNDLNIHALNIGPFRSFKLLVENPFNKCEFFAFLNNKGIINFFLGKNDYPKKEKEILQMDIALIFSGFFLVL
jgi:hypothetical protein